MAIGLPDVLVLGGGGVLGDAWMTGLLAGIEEAHGVDFTRCETYVGTSAGSIVGARLAAGRSPHRPREGGDEPAGPPGDATAAATERWLDAAATVGVAAIAPLARVVPMGANLASRASALARALALQRAPTARRDLEDLRAGIGRLGLTFGGRLRVAVV